jgi:hypothetical protein
MARFQVGFQITIGDYTSSAAGVKLAGGRRGVCGQYAAIESQSQKSPQKQLFLRPKKRQLQSETSGPNSSEVLPRRRQLRIPLRPPRIPSQHQYRLLRIPSPVHLLLPPNHPNGQTPQQRSLKHSPQKLKSPTYPHQWIPLSNLP